MTDPSTGSAPTSQRKWLRQSGVPRIACALLGVGLANAGIAVGNEVITFDIEPQRTDDALLELANTAELQILFSPVATQDTKSTGVRGSHTVPAALTAALAGTNLVFKFKADDLVVVKNAGSGGRDPVTPADDERREGVRLAQLQAAAEEGDSEDDDADEQAEAEEDIVELDEQRVTGSRLKGGDPTTQVISFSADDLSRRGISSFEELLRQMPWAYASNTTQNNTDWNGPDDVDRALGYLGFGASVANLRAMGSQNTLVLVNGRRVAGRGGSDLDRVNLLNIPLSMIERVDIDLGATSAIYGADAIGGVINFITKKRFTGLEAVVRQEYSSTDADRRTMTVRGGYSWAGGSATANVSRTDSQPINNHKIWTSMDFRALLGPEFDMRSYAEGQPGVVCEANIVRFAPFLWTPRCKWPYTYYQLPSGHSGVDATVDDFSGDIAPFDFVPPYNGEDSTNLTLNVRAEQHLNDDLMIYGETIISDHDAYRAFPTRMTSYLIPASNAYNPFGEHLVVAYWPLREVAAGSLPPSAMELESRKRTHGVGVLWRFGDSHELDVNVTRSATMRQAQDTSYAYFRDEGVPGATEFYEALRSSDPNVAFNPFGDGSVQPSDFGSFLAPRRHVDGDTVSTSAEGLLRGELFEIWGGPINYVVGGQHRKTTIGLGQSIIHFDGGQVVDVRGEAYGIERPERRQRATFIELGFPLVGEKNAFPVVRRLYLTLQARHDSYSARGPLGGVTDDRRFVFDVRAWHPDTGWTDVPGFRTTEDGTPNITKVTRSDTTPRVGLHFKPVDSLAFRAAWTESFHPPAYKQNFGTQEPGDGYFGFTDPLHPDGEELSFARRLEPGYNENLRSEYADKLSLGFDWSPEAFPGLSWSVDWSRINFTDKIEHAWDVFWQGYGEAREANRAIIAGNPEFVERDEDGYPVSITFGEINLAGKVNEQIGTTVEYSFDTDIGRFTPRLTYTKVLQEHFTLVEGAPKTDRLGTAYGSDRYKVNGRLTWQRQRLAADLFVYRIPKYTHHNVGRCQQVVGRCPNLSSGLPPVEADSLTTVDLTLTYELDNGLRVRASGRNLFESESPLPFWDPVGYDPVRWDARGRVLSLELRWTN
ncbi:MAG: TonB-dependent receptor [Gammaproteobacteria bacterium]|nr:TonB-dependent receptor [Gammaproteobacteria bacterium]